MWLGADADQRQHLIFLFNEHSTVNSQFLESFHAVDREAGCVRFELVCRNGKNARIRIPGARAVKSQGCRAELLGTKRIMTVCEMKGFRCRCRQPKGHLSDEHPFGNKISDLRQKISDIE